jgi:membrane glycosyltransferase
MIDPQDRPPAGGIPRATAPVGVQAVAGLQEAISSDRGLGSDLHKRRLTFALFAVAVMACLGTWLFVILHRNGFGALNASLFVLFALAVPSLVVPACNAVIGFVLIHGSSDALEAVYPGARSSQASDGAVAGRIVVAMVLHNEDSARAFAHFKVVADEIDRAGRGAAFDYHVLSDSTDAAAIECEKYEFDLWRAECASPNRLFYRRRLNGKGFKGGNVYEFCVEQGSQYQILILLDADSLMSGNLVLRLAQMMQTNPRLGLLQSLSVGLPSSSFFTRVFQFGHRHAMRCFILGASWWQGDICQYWGHNCAVRIRPYVEHCKPITLPGSGMLGGPVICHDQIEAALMYRAGYGVRFLPEEGGSFEGNPPALPEYLARHVRWCRGNMQNLALLNMPGLAALSFFHLAYLGLKFIGSAAVTALATVAVFAAAHGSVSGEGRSLQAFYLVCLLLYFLPKLVGVADAMIRSRSAYGGAARLLTGGLVETLLTFLLAPVAMTAATWRLLALPFGGAQTWDSYERGSHHVSFRHACSCLWPVTAFGVILLAVLAATAPSTIPWFMPFLSGLLLAIPFAVATSSHELGSWARRLGLCTIPEEIDTPTEVAAILPVVLRRC